MQSLNILLVVKVNKNNKMKMADNKKNKIKMADAANKLRGGQKIRKPFLFCYQ